MSPLRSPVSSILHFALITLAAQAGCGLLLWLSSFGQNPFPRLPLPMILMFGALAAGPLHSVARSLTWRRLSVALAASAAASFAYFVIAKGASSTQASYLAAPAAALLLTLQADGPV